MSDKFSKYDIFMENSYTTKIQLIWHENIFKIYL